METTGMNGVKRGREEEENGRRRRERRGTVTGRGRERGGTSEWKRRKRKESAWMEGGCVYRGCGQERSRAGQRERAEG